MTRMRPTYGQCRDCLRRTDVYPCSRQGGGTWSRGGRFYRSSVCGTCATAMLTHAGAHAGASVSGFSARDLDRIVSSLGTLRAAEVFTAYRERRDHRRWLRAA